MAKDPALYTPARKADVLALLRGGRATIRARAQSCRMTLSTLMRMITRS